MFTPSGLDAFDTCIDTCLTGLGRADLTKDDDDMDEEPAALVCARNNTFVMGSLRKSHPYLMQMPNLLRRHDTTE
jgi:hypothetical protein